MNRARTSLDKPPLAMSPRRLRPRRTLESVAASAQKPPPAPSPKRLSRLRHSFSGEESPLAFQKDQTLPGVKEFAQRPNMDSLSTDYITKLADGPRSPILKRGRMYEAYAARRNERLKRKMEENLEELPPLPFTVEPDLGKRKVAKKTDNQRKSMPESFLLSGPASRLRYSLRSSTTTSKAPSSVLRSGIKFKIDGYENFNACSSSLRSARRR